MITDVIGDNQINNLPSPISNTEKWNSDMESVDDTYDNTCHDDDDNEREFNFLGDAYEKSLLNERSLLDDSVNTNEKIIPASSASLLNTSSSSWHVLS